MGNGPEITIQLNLRGKPAVFSVNDPVRGIIHEAVVEAINAARIHGHSLMLVPSGSSCITDKWNEDGGDEPTLVKICTIIRAMQLEDEEIGITLDPDSVAGRVETGFCRIDLHLKK